MQETKLHGGQSFLISDYAFFRNDRKCKNKRSSGGVVILFKKSLQKGITKLNSDVSDTLWAKLDKHFFGFEDDVYLCCCYIPPQNSTFYNTTNNKGDQIDQFVQLESEVAKYSLQGEIVMMGDFNSRIGDSQEMYALDPEDLSYDYDRGDQGIVDLPYKNNLDPTKNSFGKKLKKLVNTAHLIILNGRVLGDFIGRLTSHSYNGSSSIDYGITSYSLLRKIIYFKVWTESWFSDHNAIEMCIKCNFCLDNSVSNLVPVYKYKWDDIGKTKFCDYMQRKGKLDLINFCKTNYSTVDQTVDAFNNIIKTAADKSLRIIKISSQNKPKGDKHRVNHSAKLQEAKRNFKQAKRQFSHDTKNINRRQEFINAKKKYKKFLYHFQRAEKENNLHKLAKLEKKEPKLFWTSLKTLMKPSSENTPPIHSRKWMSHFSKLLNVSPKNSNKQFSDYVKSSLPVLEKEGGDFGPLDHQVSTEEIDKCINSLKDGKAAGSDCIINEMFKCTKDIIQQPFKLIFNKIVATGMWPKPWMLSFITPIHKSGDNCDPQNYRGIAVSCCLNKIFTKILNSRLENFLTENNVLHKNQLGYQKDHRTEDSIFILHTLFEKYVTRNKQKLFVAFVDFRKFFDSINRDMLLYKLLSYGITGRFYKIIKAMYNDNCYQVKTTQGLTDSFLSNNGLKQGCNLSPSLANIYQNDLHEIFDTTCHPVSLNDLEFNTLSWADDLLIVSTSPEGLQNCLNKLQSYCYKWALEVNVSKTKFMVMSKGNTKLIPMVYLDNEPLEHVKQFKYLGIIVQQNGKFKAAIKDRILKANRALFLIKQAITSNKNVSVQLAMSLFDKMISPVLLYACPIWCLPTCTNYIYIEHNEDTVLDSKAHAENFLKDLCGTNIHIDWLKKCSRQTPLKTLVNLKYYNEKELVLQKYSQQYSADFVIKNYEFDVESTEIEKFHSNFCKFVLNISKRSSNFAVKSELARYPVYYHALNLSVKYWYRMESGTKNVFLNKAYQVQKEQNFTWVQNISNVLSSNGLREMFLAPTLLRSSKHISFLFKQRLYDQYMQCWQSNLEQSKRFTVLNQLKCTFNKSTYLSIIKSPSIRNIFTRLRIDMNMLQTCKTKTLQNNLNCPYCTHSVETVSHFILYCSHYSLQREALLGTLNENVFNFRNLCEKEKLKVILDLDTNKITKNVSCTISAILKYVSKSYLDRLNDC